MFASVLHSASLLLLLAFSSVVGAQTTVTLQHAVNSYSGTTDAWLWSGAPDTNESTQQTINLRAATTVGVMKFAIFAAEGGPVPDGAAITSATLSLYKYGTNDGVFNALRLLRPWNVSQVTWNSAASGTAWQTAGASGANDVTSSGEAQVTLGSVEGWGDFNVTTQVQAMANGNNHGWRLQAIGGTALPHNFSAADDNDTTKHPKLTLTYTTAPAGTTATLQQGLNSYTGTTDAWLWSGDPDTNVGAGVTWNIRGSTTAAVLKFAIFAAEGGPVPDNATISSATLSIYKFGTNDGVFNARRLLRPWNENQVTWNNAASGSAWQAGGATGTTDVTGAGEALLTLGSVEGWGEFDVRAAVQAMAGGNNHGWRLQAIGGSNLPHNFGAKENSNQMLRPKLTIVYACSNCGGPTAPTASFTWSQVPGTLQVVFNAAGSQENGATINALHLTGDDSVDINWNDKNLTRSHTYTAPGTYSTTLVTSNAVGDSAPVTQQIIVSDPASSGDDNCSRPGLDLCARFEANPETKFACLDFDCSGPNLYNQVRTESVVGSVVTWYAQNKAGDRADAVERITLVDGGRDGTKAIMLRTLDSDDCVHAACGGFERSEINIDVDATGAHQGTEQWWAHSVYFPAEFQLAGDPDNRSLFLQFHKTDDGIGNQPNFALEVFRQKGTTPRIVIRARTFGPSGIQYRYQVPGATLDGQCLHDDFHEERWYDFVHHIKWSATGTGIHEIWMREQVPGNPPGPVKKVLAQPNISTLFMTSGGTDSAYLKIGTYHDPVAGNSSVIHDRLRRGNSFDAVRMPDFEMPSGGVVWCTDATPAN